MKEKKKKCEEGKEKEEEVVIVGIVLGLMRPRFKVKGTSEKHELTALNV